MKKSATLKFMVMAMFVAMFCVSLTSCGSDGDNDDTATGGDNISDVTRENKDDANNLMKGLREIYSETTYLGGSKDVMFQNPEYDKQGRLTYYEIHNEFDFDFYIRYEYQKDKIIFTSSGFYKGGEVYHNEKITYTLEKGLITSYQYSSDDKPCSIKYDDKSRIVQIGDNRFFSWNSAGDLYEGKYGGLMVCKYMSSLAQMPAIWESSTSLVDACFHLDLFLLMQGYFGKSIPVHNLKSWDDYIQGNLDNLFEKCDYTYSFDSKGRCIKQTLNDEMSGNKTTTVYTLKWE